MIERRLTENGQSIEEMLRQQTESKTPIDNVSPMIYTPRKEGVKPEYDIRTDRFEIAIDAMDKFSKSGNAHKDENAENLTQETEKPAETKNE